jgi:hypothetical protein
VLWAGGHAAAQQQRQRVPRGVTKWELRLAAAFNFQGSPAASLASCPNRYYSWSGRAAS